MIQIYSFIARKGINIKIDFKYEQAFPFDYKGFAKVKKETADNYLIDTLGNEYKLATDINQLDYSITALDLNAHKLSVMLPSIFQNNQLHVLLLGSNKISQIPPEIGKMVRLNYLELYGNNLDSLPSEIGNLSFLKVLDISSNQISSFRIITQLTHLISLQMSFNKLLPFG